MRESKKKKKKKDGYDDILGLSYDKDMGKYISYVTILLQIKGQICFFFSILYYFVFTIFHYTLLCCTTIYLLFGHRGIFCMNILPFLHMKISPLILSSSLLLFLPTSLYIFFFISLSLSLTHTHTHTHV
jgi:hypothetical protein